MNDIWFSALNITFIGMGFVVLFLLLFLFATKLMSVFIQKIDRAKNNQTNAISEEEEMVIQEAVKQHIKNV